MNAPGSAALAGIRVLDLADTSGAYCGKLLGDMGADVIKVEPPAGDPARAIAPFAGGRRDGEHSLFFWHFNSSKRGVALNLDRHEDRARLDALLATADVVLLTGTPAALARRGLACAPLAERFPHLVVAAVAPFGQSGPRCEWKSCDLVAQALGGMVFVNGHPGEPPLRGSGLPAYHGAALQAAIGIVLALLVRARTGRGQIVDVSLQESVVALLEHVTASFHATGRVETRCGSLHWTGAFRLARCRDGDVLLSSAGDWTTLLEWVKADGAAGDLVDPVWEDVAHRRAHAAHLFDVLAAWAANYRVADLVAAAQLRRLPFAAVQPLAELRAHPQLRARSFFVALPDAELGPAVEYPGAPYTFSATPWRLARRAPRLAEHSAEVFAALADPSRRAVQPSTAATGRALEGVRVLDFSWHVAGPVATRVLADHGAEVIKIERPGAGDYGSRREGLTGNLNRGKRSVVVDLADPRGLAVVRELVRQCDVVIDNFSRRVMPNWGLDYAALCRLNPAIIAVGMPGFGAAGPHADDVSYGPTLQAITGYTAAMRHDGGAPAGWGFSFSDLACGYATALAVLLALWHRRRTGSGQMVEVAQLAALAALRGPALLAACAGADGSEPLGNRAAEGPAAPHGVYRCRDDRGGRERWCAIAVFGDDEWARCARAMSDPTRAADSRFATLAARLAHERELDALVESWTAPRSVDDVVAALQAAGVAAGVVADAEDFCARDPHLAARGYWATVDTSEGTRVVLDGVASRLSLTPGCVAAPAPLLGEHTAQVLHDLLGLEQSALVPLRGDRVAG